MRIARRSKKLSWRLFGPPPLLKGEDAAVYDELLARLSRKVEPSDIFQVISIRDYIDTTVVIFRLRRLSTTLLEAAVSDARDRAIKPVVDKELDRLLREVWAQEQKERQKQEQQEQQEPELSPQEWKKRAEQNPTVIKKLREVRASAEAELDMDALTAQAFVNELEHIERIDRLTMIAEGRRNAILREIDHRRAPFVQALRATVREVEGAKFETNEPKAIMNKRSA